MVLYNKNSRRLIHIFNKFSCFKHNIKCNAEFLLFIKMLVSFYVHKNTKCSQFCSFIFDDFNFWPTSCIWDYINPPTIEIYEDFIKVFGSELTKEHWAYGS